MEIFEKSKILSKYRKEKEEEKIKKINLELAARHRELQEQQRAVEENTMK